MSISDLYRAVSSAASVQPSTENKAAGVKPPQGGPSDFEKILQGQQSLNLSQHAETRIRSRSIPWDAGIEKRIMSGIDAAQAKGSREALILADNVAVIANIKSRTIITAMDKSQLKQKIFTNIDSAVLV